MASEEEKQKLTAWKKYRGQLNRLDISTTKDID
ncbi:MAG: tail fiber assembly protein [Arsenophonus sp. NEOnobi-MAG3]